MRRNARDLVELADRVVEHGFKCGTVLSEPRLKELYTLKSKLFSMASDMELGRGVFGGGHGAANESKYGYMSLISVSEHGIEVDDYYDWSAKWIDEDTIELADSGGGECMQFSYDELVNPGELPFLEGKQVVVDLLLKLRP